MIFWKATRAAVRMHNRDLVILDLLLTGTCAGLLCLLLHLDFSFMAVVYAVRLLGWLVWLVVWTMTSYRRGLIDIEEKNRSLQNFVEEIMAPELNVGPTFLKLRQLTWNQATQKFRRSYLERTFEHIKLLGPDVCVVPAELKAVEMFDPTFKDSFWLAVAVEMMLQLKVKKCTPEDRQGLLDALCDLGIAVKNS